MPEKCPYCKYEGPDNFALSGHIRAMEKKGDEAHKGKYQEWKAQLEASKQQKAQPVQTQPQPTPVEKPTVPQPTQPTPTVKAPEPTPTEEQPTPEIKMKREPEPTTPQEEPTQPTPVIRMRQVLPQTPEPEEWFRSFMSQFGVNKSFIELQCSRIRRRGELPHPHQLATDMKDMNSGFTKIREIQLIMDDYQYELKNYLGQYQAQLQQQAIGGIPLPPQQQQQQQQYYGGYPTPQQQPQQQFIQRGVPIPQQQPIYYDNQGRPIQIIQQPFQQQQSFESELERFVRMDNLLHKTEEETPQMRAMREELNMLKEARDRDKEAEMSGLRQRVQQDDQNLKIRDQRIQDLTEEVRSLQFQQSQKGLTETDIKAKEIDSQFNLKTKEIEEKGKTREAIATAVKESANIVGQAIGRTLKEAEVQQAPTIPVAGVADQQIMQMPCPNCSSMITAPSTATMVRCPTCMKQWEVGAPPEQPPTQPEPQTYQQPPPPPIQQPEQPPTVEPPPPRRVVDTSSKIRVGQPPPVRIEQEPEAKLSFTVEQPEEPIHPQDTIVDQEVVEPETKPPQQVAATTLIKKDETEKVYEEPPPPKLPLPPPTDTTKTLKYQEAPADIKKIAEGIAIGEAADKLEEKLKKEEPKPLSEETFKKSEEPHLMEPAERLEEEIRKEETKQFICPEPGCGKSFDREAQLRGHILGAHKKKKK